MDQPGHPPGVLAGNLDDLRRANRWLGGTRLSSRALDHLLSDRPLTTPCRLLDVGTGGADIPAAIAESRSLNAQPVEVWAIDVSEDMLAQAQRRTAGRVVLAAADGRRLPFADGSFDVAMCSLILHHLGPADAESALLEMRRVSSIGVVVNDLVRSSMGFVGAWLFGNLCSRNPLTRHDAPLSVRRAYTRDEIRNLMQRVGLRSVHEEAFLFRIAFAAVAG
jgi:ubiquinone/menaquinone biosynthesis C-methylase UbiE